MNGSLGTTALPESLGEANDSLYCVVIVFLLSLLRFCIARSQIADVFESLTGALEGWCVLYLKDYILIVEILRTEQEDVWMTLILGRVAV